MNIKDMEANAEMIVKHVADTSPPEVGAIMIMYDRRSGRCIMRANDASMKAVIEVMRSMVEKNGREDSRIILPGGLWK